MEKFMPNYHTYGAEEADYHYKPNIITICLRFLNVEPETLWINVIAHDDQSPNGSDIFENNKEL